MTILSFFKLSRDELLNKIGKNKIGYETSIYITPLMVLNIISNNYDSVSLGTAMPVMGKSPVMYKSIEISTDRTSLIERWWVNYNGDLLPFRMTVHNSNGTSESHLYKENISTYHNTNITDRRSQIFVEDPLVAYIRDTCNSDKYYQGHSHLHGILDKVYQFPYENHFVVDNKSSEVEDLIDRVGLSISNSYDKNHVSRANELMSLIMPYLNKSLPDDILSLRYRDSPAQVNHLSTHMQSKEMYPYVRSIPIMLDSYIEVDFDNDALFNLVIEEVRNLQLTDYDIKMTVSCGIITLNEVSVCIDRFAANIKNRNLVDTRKIMSLLEIINSTLVDKVFGAIYGYDTANVFISDMDVHVIKTFGDEMVIDVKLNVTDGPESVVYYTKYIDLAALSLSANILQYYY